MGDQTQPIWYLGKSKRRIVRPPAPFLFQPSFMPLLSPIVSASLLSLRSPFHQNKPLPLSLPCRMSNSCNIWPFCNYLNMLQIRNPRKEAAIWYPSLFACARIYTPSLPFFDFAPCRRHLFSCALWVSKGAALGAHPASFCSSLIGPDTRFAARCSYSGRTTLPNNETGIIA